MGLDRLDVEQLNRIEAWLQVIGALEGIKPNTQGYPDVNLQELYEDVQTDRREDNERYKAKKQEE